MKHHKQVATTITFSDQQFATLIETLKTPIANPASDAKLEQALTALSTWTENNPKLPTATDVAGITAAIQNSGDQTRKQLKALSDAVTSTIPAETKGTYFKDYGLPTTSTLLSITSLVLGIVLAKSIDNSNTNNITIDTQNDDHANTGNSTNPSASSAAESDTSSLFTGLAIGLIIGLAVGAGSYHCFVGSERREDDYAVAGPRDNDDQEDNQSPQRYQHEIELGPQGPPNRNSQCVEEI